MFLRLADGNRLVSSPTTLPNLGISPTPNASEQPIPDGGNWLGTAVGASRKPASQRRVIVGTAKAAGTADDQLTEQRVGGQHNAEFRTDSDLQLYPL